MAGPCPHLVSSCVRRGWGSLSGVSQTVYLLLCAQGDAADFWLHLKGDSGILILSDSIVLWASVYLCAVSPSVSEEFL